MVLVKTRRFIGILFVVRTCSMSVAPMIISIQGSLCTGYVQNLLFASPATRYCGCFGFCGSWFFFNTLLGLESLSRLQLSRMPKAAGNVVLCSAALLVCLISVITIAWFCLDFYPYFSVGSHFVSDVFFIESDWFTRALATGLEPIVIWLASFVISFICGLLMSLWRLIGAKPCRVRPVWVGLFIHPLLVYFLGYVCIPSRIILAACGSSSALCHCSGSCNFYIRACLSLRAWCVPFVCWVLLFYGFLLG